MREIQYVCERASNGEDSMRLAGSQERKLAFMQSEKGAIGGSQILTGTLGWCVENRLEGSGSVQGDQLGCQRSNERDVDLHQMGASEGGEKWLDPGYILNIDPLGSKFISR